MNLILDFFKLKSFEFVFEGKIGDEFNRKSC